LKDRNKNRPGYKKTKVGWIPEDWNGKQFRALSIAGPQNGLYKKQSAYGKGYRMVHMRHLFANNLISDQEMPRVQLSETEKNNYLLKNGDLLFGRRSLAIEGAGKCSLVQNPSEPLTFESSIIRITPDTEVLDAKYTYYYIESPFGRYQMYTFTRVVTVAGIAGSDLKLYTLPVPPIPEQKKIAEILSTWDKAIEQMRKFIDAKKHRKKALMQQLLTGKKRLPRFLKSKGRNSYRFFDLPEDWECPQIRDVAQECSERNTGRDDLTVLSCSKHRGFVESSEYFGKQVFSADTSNYKVISRNYFGYPSNHIEEGSIGLLLTHDLGIVSPIYTVFKCIDNIIPEYLYAVFKTDTFRHIFAISTNSSVDRRGSLRWGEFSLIRVPHPSIKEQQAIVDVLNVSDREIAQLDTKLKALEKQKRGLMQKLLTGEVRVSV